MLLFAHLRLFERQTNVTVVTQSGKFYTFNLKFAEKPSQLSFVVDPAANAANKRVALLDNKELNSVQRENLRKEINSVFSLSISSIKIMPVSVLP